jgi:hypothetical protein
LTFLLRLVGMIWAHIDLQFSELRSAEPVLGEHPPHRRLHEPLGVLSPDLLGTKLTDSPGVAGMVVITLARLLGAGQPNLLGVDDDDVITRVEKGSVRGLFFSGQDSGDAAR